MNTPAFETQEREVTANGLSIGVSVSHPAHGHTQPLLLIHGAEADRTMFASLTARLAGRFTVIAYDQRDSGRTIDRHPGGVREYALPDLADDAAALVEALGYRRMHVLGTSLGGHIAQVLAARHPNCIDRLILGSTWAAGQPLSAINPTVAQKLIGWRADPQRHQRQIAELFFPPMALDAEPERLAMFGKATRSPEQAARRARLLGTPYPIADRQIETETLLLMGEADALVPNDATRAIARTLTRHQAVALAGVGHIFALQAPIEAARVIADFLDGA